MATQQDENCKTPKIDPKKSFLKRAHDFELLKQVPESSQQKKAALCIAVATVIGGIGGRGVDISLYIKLSLPQSLHV